MQAEAEELIIEQGIEAIRFLDIKFIDVEDFTTLILRLLFNVLITFIIVKVTYYSTRKDKDYLFTFFIFNILVFFVCHLLSSIKLSIGFAFGLFALFSILRYRTTTLPVKEMTYLFAVITIAVINALSTKKVSYMELVFTNMFIVGLIYFLEKLWLTKQMGVHSITYEKIENIKPQNKTILIQDLSERTGLKINNIEITRINFLNDTARIKIFYNKDDASAIAEFEERNEYKN